MSFQSPDWKYLDVKEKYGDQQFELTCNDCHFFVAGVHFQSQYQNNAHLDWKTTRYGDEMSKSPPHPVERNLKITPTK